MARRAYGYSAVAPLRAACSSWRSFLSLRVALAGIRARRDPRTLPTTCANPIDRIVAAQRTTRHTALCSGRRRGAAEFSLPDLLAGCRSAPLSQLRRRVIHAEDGTQASAAPLEAARMRAQQPQAIPLRYLQTMTQVAGGRGATVVFPLPTALLDWIASSAHPCGDPPPTGRGPAA